MSNNPPDEKPWWRRLDGVPPEHALRPKFTRPPLVGWRLIRRIVLIVPAFGLGLVSGFRVDRPAELAIFSALVLAIVLPDILIAEGPWLWSQALDAGPSGQAWALTTMTPYLTAFATPALVVSATRWLL